MSAIRAEAISKAFGATLALSDVSFEAKAGQVHALVGENGSGKSTLMRILAGEEHPDSGRMFVQDKPYSPHSPLDSRRFGVALIHQELALCEHLTVAENIFLGGESRVGPTLSVRAMAEMAREILSGMGYPELDPATEVRRISQPMKQVVEIAKALAREASIFIFDEPTSSLGKSDVENLFRQIRILQGKGCSVIYISHFLDEVMEIADVASVLRDGKMIGSVEVAKTNTQELVRMMVGRDVAELYPRSEHASGETLLKVAGLGGVKKPVEASFELRRGEVLGIAGLNGSGRTELIRAIFGLDPIVSGAVSFGIYSGFAKPHDRWRQGGGFLSEDRKSEGLALKLSLAENMTMPFPGRKGIVRPGDQRERTQVWIDRLGVRCKGPEQPIGELSGGNQQKIALARLLDRDVDLLLLDEPTRGIDIGSKAQIYAVIDELASRGKAIILVSSYLPELLGVCDQIAVMSRGKLGAPVSAKETDAEQLMEACVQA